MNNDNQQKKVQRNGNNRQHGNRQQGDRNNGRQRPKVIEMELFFIEQTYGGGRDSTPMALLQDGTRIFPRSPRFNPKTCTEQDLDEKGWPKSPDLVYSCLVRFWEGKDVADCMIKPGLEYKLSPDEYLSDEEWRKAIVVPLTFQVDQRGDDKRPKAWHRGKIVFVDRDSEVSINKTRLYMLTYGGRVAYAHALPQAAGATGPSTALVFNMASKLGELSFEGMKYVVLKVAQNKPGVAMPKSDKDLVIKQAYRSVYELLGITAEATEEEIKRAYRAKSRVVHPDAVLPKLGKHATVKDEMNVRFFFDAVEQANKQALDIIAHVKEQKKAKAPKAEAPVEPSSTPAVPAVETEAQVETTSTEAPVETTETTATIESAPADEIAPIAETAPAVEAPVPVTLSPEAKLEAAAALAKISVEEFKTKASGFQKHFLQTVERTLSPKAGGQSAKKQRSEKPKNAPKKGLEALAELKAEGK